MDPTVPEDELPDSLLTRLRAELDAIQPAAPLPSQARYAHEQVGSPGSRLRFAGGVALGLTVAFVTGMAIGSAHPALWQSQTGAFQRIRQVVGVPAPAESPTPTPTNEERKPPASEPSPKASPAAERESPEASPRPTSSPEPETGEGPSPEPTSSVEPTGSAGGDGLAGTESITSESTGGD